MSEPLCHEETGGSEPIAHTNAYCVIPDFHTLGHKRKCGSQISARGPEVCIAIIHARAPSIGERVFQSGADGPTCFGLCPRLQRTRGRPTLKAEMAKGNATGNVREEAIKSIPHPGAHGALPAQIGATCTPIAKWIVEAVFNVGIFDIAFDAHDKRRVELVVVSDIHTTHESARGKSPARNWTVEGITRPRPLVTGLSTDIESGPVIRRRHRFLGQNVRSERAASCCEDSRSREQNRSHLQAPYDERDVISLERTHIIKNRL